MRETISLVVPIYNEENNILRLYQSLLKVTSCLNNFDWHFIFVNDGSSDQSIERLKDISESDERILVLDFSRNFGKEVALTAGVYEARTSTAVICIDADLQHPPELIPEFVRQWQEGADTVIGIRVESERQTLLRRLGSRVFYAILRKISTLDMTQGSTDYRLINEKVVSAFILATERNRMFRGIMDWLGFRRSYVHFSAPSRIDGQSKYAYSKLVHLALSALTTFSLWPLRVTGYIGVLISGGSILVLGWMLVNFMIGSHYQYTPLAMFVVANTFLIGLVLMAIGMVALYIGTIHTEVINRPLYVIRDKIKKGQTYSELSANDYPWQ